MQKKIIALAIAGLVSGGAFAQSNVTISGEMKVGYEGVSAGGATSNVALGANMTSRQRITDNNSKIKIAGEETLGNGMTAWWQMESAIGSSDNIGTTAAPVAAGANSATLGTRNTAVGIKGAFGNFFMGKWDVHYNSAGGVDSMGLADGHGLMTSSLSILHTNGAVGTATNASAANGFGGRLNNVMSYTSPNFSGFAIDVKHSTSGMATGTQSENTSPNMAAKEKTWAFNPTYNNGPITAFYSWAKATNHGAVVQANVAGNSGSDITGQRLGGAYTLPMGLKIGLIWDKNKFRTADGTATLLGLGVTAANGGGGNVGVHNSRERTAWAVPVQYVTGAHKVNFTYAVARNLKTDVGTVDDSGAKMYVIGYEYSLSKRTSVAASWLSINNGRNAAYDGWHPSSSVAGTSGLGMSAGADPRVLQMNLRHAF